MTRKVKDAIIRNRTKKNRTKLWSVNQEICDEVLDMSIPADKTKVREWLNFYQRTRSTDEVLFKLCYCLNSTAGRGENCLCHKEQRFTNNSTSCEPASTCLCDTTISELNEQCHCALSPVQPGKICICSNRIDSDFTSFDDVCSCRRPRNATCVAKPTSPKDSSGQWPTNYWQWQSVNDSLNDWQWPLGSWQWQQLENRSPNNWQWPLGSWQWQQLENHSQNNWQWPLGSWQWQQLENRSPNNWQWPLGSWQWQQLENRSPNNWQWPLR